MSTDQSPTTTDTAAGRPPRDLRRFWRVLLAVVAPLPMLALAIHTLLSPVAGGTGFKDTVAAYAAHRQLADSLQWVNAVFVIGLVPAAFAVAWVSRRGAPRLATAGALLSLSAFLSAFPTLPDDNTLALLTVQEKLDLTTVEKLDQALWATPLVSITSGLFILGLTIGLGLLGAALWRSRVAPAWMGIALMVGAVTHPFIPGQVGAAAGLAIGAVGFAGAGVALLRTRDDDFDLPPSRHM
ncbi:hypothetical protein [Streptosporangium lutulentum]|uniref:DUF4386 family protein n=1 Tax=Streptosporangium lutulentum TaxID=1461250 RepID=A0ABT9QAT1_9ACTN|nr:hypothetical protein [Streptosporangium lutulentum]MDP9843878.1 hypothetical protein [Streptosporangium lutulentum]